MDPSQHNAYHRGPQPDNQHQYTNFSDSGDRNNHNQHQAQPVHFMSHRNFNVAASPINSNTNLPQFYNQNE